MTRVRTSACIQTWLLFQLAGTQTRPLHKTPWIRQSHEMNIFRMSRLVCIATHFFRAITFLYFNFDCFFSFFSFGQFIDQQRWVVTVAPATPWCSIHIWIRWHQWTDLVAVHWHCIMRRHVDAWIVYVCWSKHHQKLGESNSFAISQFLDRLWIRFLIDVFSVATVQCVALWRYICCPHAKRIR